MSWWRRLFEPYVPPVPPAPAAAEEEERMVRLELPARPRYDVKKGDDLVALDGSQPAVKRCAGGLRVTEVAGAALIDDDRAAFDALLQQVRTVPPPEQLSVWVLRGDALEDLSGDAFNNLITRLYKLTVANQTSPPAGDAIVLVSETPPDPANVYMLTSLGLGVYHAAPDKPLPVVTVGFENGQSVAGMIGKPI